MDLGPGCDVEPELGTLPRPCSLDIAKERIFYFMYKMVIQNYPIRPQHLSLCVLMAHRIEFGLSVVQAGAAAGHAGCF